MKRFLLLLLFALPALAQYDVLIRNGRVMDGAGNPWIQADVGIVGDRIAFIGRASDSVTAKRTIDAKGLIVAPGFIDMLGQSEMSLLIDKQAFSKLTQGVTTEITGEGESVAPQTEATIAAARDFTDHFHFAIDWHALSEYFARLAKQGSGVNVGTYVGAAQVRAAVIGRDNRPPTADELAQMKQHVEDAMQEGALGLSTALIYAPGNYAKTEELIELAKVAAQYGGIYASHIRSEGDAEVQALEEAFRIGRAAGLPVEIFHLKVAGKPYWGKMADRIRMIEEARASGLDVSANQYPYLAGATSLGSSIPPKYHEGGTDAMTARLKDPAVRARIRRDLDSPNPDFESLWRLSGPENVLVNSVLNPELKQFEGKRVSEIARLQNKDSLDALLDIVIADHDNTGAIYFMMSEDDMKLALRQPWVSVGTDYGEVSPTGPLAEGKAHPRAYGSFPRILGKYVREQHVLTMEEAIRKFTSLAAQRVHLRERGELRPGWFADITIFDPQTVNDRATYENPAQPSVGIQYVLVNGVLSVDQGKLTGQVGGRPLRGPGYRGPSSGQTGPGSVRGFVSDTGGYPMGRVAVTIKDAAGKEVASAPVLYDGKFDIPLSAACQKCTITAARMGFVTDTRPMDFNGVNSLWFGFALKTVAAP
jgi:dihydroorotase/N-acyl-D-amino-acid deacylase